MGPQGSFCNNIKTYRQKRNPAEEINILYNFLGLPEPVWGYLELCAAKCVGTRRAQVLDPAQTGGVAVVVTYNQVISNTIIQ